MYPLIWIRHFAINPICTQTNITVTTYIVAAKEKFIDWSAVLKIYFSSLMFIYWKFVNDLASFNINTIDDFLWSKSLVTCWLFEKYSLAQVSIYIATGRIAKRQNKQKANNFYNSHCSSDLQVYVASYVSETYCGLAYLDKTNLI